MTEQIRPLDLISGEQRRRFLRLAGSAAALLPIVAITGCGSDAPPAAPAAPSPSSPTVRSTEPARAVEAAPAPAPEAAPERTAEVASEALPELDLNDPTARALGYQHDAGPG